MFSFFFRKPKITLDCFTCIPELPILFPIIHSSDRLPEFYKKIPSTVVQNGPTRGTMKTCPGVSDYFKKGFILQAWSDYYINTENSCLTWNPEIMAESHNPKQWGNDSFKNFYHLKLVSPWLIKEKTGVNFLFTNVLWHDDQTKYVVPNGVLNFKYQHTTSVNTLIQRTQFPKDFVISAGTPLAHVIPLSENDIEIKMHEVTEFEFERIKAYVFTFNGNYYKRKKILQSREK